MIKFKNHQTTLEIGGVKIGGQPGENPTVAIASIFYPNHSITKDSLNKARARELVENLKAVSADTHIPVMLDVYATTPENAKERLQVAAEFDLPLCLDSSEPSVRKEMVGIAKEIGIADKCIYNSINLGIEDSEVPALKESGVHNSLVLGFNPMKSTADSRIDVYDTGAGIKPKGLLELAADAGVDGILLDSGVILFGQGAGPAIRAFTLLKAKYGFPVGAAIHNAITAWEWLKGKDFKKECDYACNLVAALHADFVMFGPIEYAEKVLPIIAMGDLIVADAMQDQGIIPTKNHPINFLR